MNRLFARLLGIEPTSESALGADWRLEFANLNGPRAGLVALLAAIGVLVVIALAYRRESQKVTTRYRTLLIGLRLAALAALAWMLLEPVLVLIRSEERPAGLLVLVDRSESMGIRDPWVDEAAGLQTAEAAGLKGDTRDKKLDELRRKTRLELSTAALSGVSGDLANGRQLFWYSFGGRVEPTDDKQLPGLKPDLPVTAIGSALRSALANHRGQPLAGVVLVTDGQSNAGEEASIIARQLGVARVPIVAVTAGTTDGPRNLTVAGIDASPIVFVRDPTRIPVAIESRGLKGQTATIVLEEKRENADWAEAGRQEITLGEEGQLQRVLFPWTPDRIGQVEFRAVVDPLPAELSKDDNRSATSVRVVRHRIRVLLIAGSPTPEVQFLRNTLLRDETLEFAAWLQHADDDYEQQGTRPVRRLPKDQKELDEYDVVLLVDPDLSRLDPAWNDMLVKFVGEAGGGLILIAGEVFTTNLFEPGRGDGNAAGQPDWVKLLPVARDPGLFRTEAEVALSNRETWTLEITPEGQEDPIFQFAPDPVRNRQTIASLPGMFWHFPVTRAKPGATVLARHGDPRMNNQYGRHVLLATQLAGPGRTAFVGFDSTYRWRYLNEQFFDGFWARLVDRLGRAKALGGRYPIALSTDRETYRAGDRVVLRVRSTSADGTLPGVNGEVEQTGGQPQPLTFEPSMEETGSWQATFTAESAGVWTARVLPGSAVEADAPARAASLNIKVEPARQEFEKPALNLPLLESIASLSGGKVLSPGRIRELDGSFPIRTVTKSLEESKELWDAPLAWIVLIGSLTLEWILRKRARMA